MSASVTRTLQWGQLQRAKAALARELLAWRPDHLPAEQRSAARRQQHALLVQIRGVKVPSRQVSMSTLEREWPASQASEMRTTLASNLQTYDFCLCQPLEDSAPLQTVLAWNSKLISQLDKLAMAADEASPDTPLPPWLTKARQNVKQDRMALVKAADIAKEIEQTRPGGLKPHPTTPAELMALTGLTELTADQRQRAWQVGATPGDLIRLQKAKPPAGVSWLLLADHLLPAQDRPSVLLVYPLSEIALMVRAALEGPQAPLEGFSALMRVWIDRHRPKDATGQPWDAVADAVTPYAQTLGALLNMAVGAALVATAAADAKAALDQLQQTLLALIDDSSTARSVRQSIEDTLQDICHRELLALEQLPAMARRMGVDDDLALPLLHRLLSEGGLGADTSTLLSGLMPMSH